jgi:hypothetical protein
MRGRREAVVVGTAMLIHEVVFAFAVLQAIGLGFPSLVGRVRMVYRYFLQGRLLARLRVLTKQEPPVVLGVLAANS